MVNKVKTETELQAWDIYIAAALQRAFETTNGNSPSDHINNAVKRAGEIADRILIERRLRVI